ncbi:MAG: transposase [Thermoplasmata archaeon]
MGIPSLAHMFDQINLSKLENLFPTQRWGRPRYVRTAMLAAVLVLYLRGLGSYRYLSDFLAKDHFWARKCGFEDRTPDQSSFSRFLSLLDDRMLDRINGIFVEEVRRPKRLLRSLLSGTRDPVIPFLPADAPTKSQMRAQEGSTSERNENDYVLVNQPRARRYLR